MIVDKLISRYVRHLNHRQMNFQACPGDNSLPDPDPDRRYLLYLHIPFCVVLCPFCSFHRVEFRQDRATQYFEALQEEIRRTSQLGYRFGEIYVGGGTPTVLPDALGETIRLVSSLHDVSAVSVETNPLDLDTQHLEQLTESGVNRLSVGVQSFDDGLLREMERYEKYGSGVDIIEHLENVSGAFDTLNVDMIFNCPHQSEASLRTDLDILTRQLSVDQVSWYPLMAAESTSRPMARQIGSIEYSRERKYYEIIAEHMTTAGYERSSAWCFSRQAGMFDEYIVEHEEYVGLGSGAFSYIDGAMYANTFSINNYLRLIGEGRSSTVQKRQMSLLEQMRYYMLLKLFSGRMSMEVAERRFDGRFAKTLWRDLGGLRLIGAVVSDGGDLRLTESGYYLWVVLMREFFSGVNNFRDDMRHNIGREIARRPSTQPADFG